jgi:hypothetical protein
VGEWPPYEAGSVALFRNMMNTLVNKYIALALRVHEAALDISRSFQFDQTHPWHRDIITLYGSILELHGSICILVREKIGTGIPILLRSIVEAHLDLNNLAQDRTYGYRMRASELKECEKVLKNAKAGHNPFLKDLASEYDVGDALSEVRKELESLKRDGYNPLSQKDKFVSADLTQVYESVYNMLCCEAHNNRQALTSRHVRIRPDESDFDIEYYAPVEDQSILFYLDCLCYASICATEIIHKALDMLQPCFIGALKSELDNLRTEYKAEQRDTSNPHSPSAQGADGR